VTGSLIIRGGHVVTAADTFRADVLIADGKIVALGTDDGWTADRVIDAEGHYILPGGIDTHTHFEHHNLKGTTRTADDFKTGSAASAAGGTTTFVDFVRGLPGESLIDAFHRRRQAAEQGSMIDFGFHLMVPATANSDDSFDQLRHLTEEFGATSWKFFMAYTGLMVPDDVLIRGFTEARALGVLPMVHAENGHMVNAAVEALVEQGLTEEHHHMHGHPAAAEREAIVRAATIAEWVDTPLFIVHVSSADGVNEIQALQNRGRPVFGETCPHYLVTGYEDYSHADYEAAKYICSPPIRESRHQEPLWNALATGVLGSVGTDHATYTMDQPEDLPPQKPQGRGYFPNVPPGVPGGRGTPHGSLRTGGRARTFRPEPIRRHDVDQPGQNVRSLPPQGHHRARFRCRRGHLGSAGRAHHLGRPTPVPGRIHPLRGHVGQRSSAPSLLARRADRPRRRTGGDVRARSLPIADVAERTSTDSSPRQPIRIIPTHRL